MLASVSETLANPPTIKPTKYKHRALQFKFKFKIIKKKEQ